MHVSLGTVCCAGGLQQAPGAQLGGAFTNGTLQMHPAAMSAQSFAAPEPLAAPGPAAALLAHMEAPPASPVLAGGSYRH